MSLFVSTSNLQFHQLDCSSLNISDTIERECLSVLHKLHDQVNGLQLVQVVVQPLARLFNPASLAALVASSSTSSPSSKQSAATSNVPNLHQNANSTSGTQSTASTPSTHYPPTLIGHHQTDSDGTNMSSASQGNQHSRSQSFASSFGVGGGGGGSSSSGVASAHTHGNNSLLSTTSTYMMSPDTAQALIARLDSDRDVNWLMEIIGYGLSMPFSLTGEQDSVKDCCTIYCEWLAAALLPFNEQNEDSKYQQLNKLVPVPIRKEPNRYARKMLSHLYNVFLPRQPISTPVMTTTTKNNSSVKDDSDALLTAVSRQAVLCHRVLRTIESIAHNRTNLMDDETWHHLLALLLTVNDKLLSPPTEPDDIGTQLHDRILGVLFDLMLLACSRSIPDASMWKTFHEMCLNWRHRPALIEHWRRIASLLTKRIVLAPANHHKGFNINDVQHPSALTSPIESSIVDMSYENLSQTWYRFLNLIGNPVELSDPSLISRTDEFYHAACVANSVLDPRQHPCLNVLPQIFLNSMLGLKEYVESFLGTYHHHDHHQQQQASLSSRRSSQQIDLSQHHQIHQQHQQQQNQQHVQFRLNPDRPKCNSILHIFGDWLFSAALIGSELSQELEPAESQTDVEYSNTNISGSITSVASSMTATEAETPSQGYSPAFRRKQSHQSTTSSHASSSIAGGGRRRSKQLETSGLLSERITLDAPLTPESFESGQAEAMALLCKIFSSKTTLEDISPAYLARFYLCLQHCLNFGSGLDPRQPNQVAPIKRQLLASVLMNSTLLLQKDLDGINLLIPSLITAIEFVFECNEKEIPVQAPPRQHSKTSSLRVTSNANQPLRSVTNYDLRRSCILTLINLLAYPPHFRDLAIRSCLDGTSPTTTFGSLRPRLMKMLFVALQTETDATNMQLLLGGLSLAIHDLKTNSNRQTSRARDSLRVKGETVSSESSHNSMEPDDKTRDPDTLSQSSFVFNSNDGFLIKSLHVTCHLLINIWKHDNLVSLVALEVLTTIARVSTTMGEPGMDHGTSQITKGTTTTNNNNVIEMRAEYMQATKWICDYICNQCSRPPPAHSRDMHSTIVAAYQCLSVWFYNHPYLLDDSICINTLMEVIELGVSGQKSRSMSMNSSVGMATPSIISKGEKAMKPSSMRVREAAESLLNTCLVRTRLHGPRNIAYCDTVMTEAEILDSYFLPGALSRISDWDSRRMEAVKAFQYFSDEDSIVFALIECASLPDNTGGSGMKDGVICLLRTPFGKQCWRFSFRYCSERAREKIIANKTLGLMKRPFQQSSTTFSDVAVAFPSAKSAHNRSIYFNNAARFFPDDMDDVPVSDLDKLVTSLDDYMRNQTDLRVKVDLDKMSKLYSHQVLAEQKVVSEFTIRRSAKRMECEEPAQPTSGPESIRVVAQHLGLKNRLEIKARPPCHGLSQSFIDGLRALDEQSVRTCDSVDVFYVRRGRTSLGDILDSVRERQNVQVEFFEWLSELGQPTVNANTNTYNSNSDCLTLHWGDMCQELKFRLPAKGGQLRSSAVLVCWLECSEDVAKLPLDDLTGGEPLRATPQDTVRYHVCPMKSGLFRVNMSVPFASPLVDGMTLNKSTLSRLMRESILNLCRRRRLDADSYQPPHVKRRILLQELCNNHKVSLRH